MAHSEILLNHKIRPNDLSTEPNGWPHLKYKWASQVLLTQMYHLSYHAEPSKSGKLKIELEQMERKMTHNKPDYFSEKNQKKGRDRLKISKEANFSSSREEDSLTDIIRTTNNLSSRFINENHNNWFDLYSKDRKLREKAYLKLNVINPELVSMIIRMMKLRHKLRITKSGKRVREYFILKDGIDWERIFENRNLEENIKSYASEISILNKNDLGIQKFLPFDLYARSNKETNLNNIYFNKDHENSGDLLLGELLKKFLSFIGLSEFSSKLEIIGSKRGNTGYLAYLNNDNHTTPIVFHQEGNGRKFNSLNYLQLLIHEAGHAFSFFTICNISPPLFGLTSNLSEFPSILFEKLLMDPEMLAQLGLDKLLIFKLKKRKYEEGQLINQIMNAEFEYRLHKLIEGGKLNEESIGELYATLKNKYYDVNYSDREKDNTWQYNLSRHLSHSENALKSYFIGNMLALTTMQMLHDELGNKSWIGTSQFNSKFLELFKQLFKNGPFTDISDIEQILGDKGDKMESLIKNQLEKVLF